MTRTAATVLVLAVALLGAPRLNAALAHPRHIPVGATSPTARIALRPPLPTASRGAPALSPDAGAPAGSASLIRGADSDEVGVARRWVAAMWTRPPGDPPFAWLERVADITTPGLDAQLRDAIPTLDDAGVVSAGVQIDGAYPDALDPDTVTVTCVAHLVTTTGPLDEPCATTVTLTPGPDGSLLVAAVA